MARTTGRAYPPEMKTARPFQLLLALLATPILACGGTSESPPAGGCTQIGCEDGLTIEFSAKQPGAYTFDIVADGQTITCNATLPLPPCSSPPTPNCSVAGVSLTESGCALVPSAHSLEGLYFYDMHPKSVEVTVLRDGAEVARQTFAPAYKTVAPNGVECGPVCEQATVSLAVP